MMRSAKLRPAHLLIGAITTAIAVLGIYILTETLIELVRSNWFVPFVQFGFGGLCLFVAHRSWFFRTARSVRWLCSLAALVVFWFPHHGHRPGMHEITKRSLAIITTNQPDLKIWLLCFLPWDCYQQLLRCCYTAGPFLGCYLVSNWSMYNLRAKDLVRQDIPWSNRVFDCVCWRRNFRPCAGTSRTAILPAGPVGCVDYSWTLSAGRRRL